MKKYLLLCALGFCSVATGRADLSGTWRLDLSRRGEVTLHSYFVLHQESTALDGKVVINGAVDLRGSRSADWCTVNIAPPLPSFVPEKAWFSSSLARE